MPHTTDNLTLAGQCVPRKSGKVIYTVTTIRHNGDNKHNRTVGWFADKLEAFGCLDKNIGSLVECGYYQFAVVEELPDGVYPYNFSDESRITKWWWRSVGKDAKTEHWERIDNIPAELNTEHACHFAEIG